MRSHAFGINVETTFEAPGLPEGGARLPRTRIERVSEQEIAGRWDAARAERLQQETLSQRRRQPDRTIDRSPAGEYLLYARHFGTALISASGDRVLCAPPAVEAWRWQRFLVGRVLPWAALLRGRELLHASTVRIGDRAVAVLAASGFGKTSVAARLMLRGGGFITDDVLALTDDGGEVLAHPGPAIVALRPSERDALEPGERRRLGRVLGRSGKTYVAVEREPAPVPLGALYFLEPAAEGGGFESGVDPRRLLASAFIAGVDSPRRLEGLLDLCARLEATVPIWRIGADYETGAAALADAIWEHAGGGSRRT
ncbi:MAG: hypothetical protein QOI10_2566 [Solirubrobacterales bacterium]|nr:hypothetical protein [Solirubrobacterales bacterium]